MDDATKNTALVAGGMGALLLGSKLSAVSMFAKGAMGLEKKWRDDNDFDGTWGERWQRAIDFYDQTHQDRTNRVLHIVGIPMIAGGAAGMLVSPSFTPPWLLSAASFTAGWALNFVGHGVFEKGEPAFLKDPLAFAAGPVWDAQNLAREARKRLSQRGSSVPEASAA